MGRSSSGRAAPCYVLGRMRATHLCLAFALLVGCLVGTGAVSGLEPELELGEEAAPPAPTVNKDKRAFEKKMRQLAELHEEAMEVKNENTEERNQKSIKASAYNTKWNAKHERLTKKQHKLKIAMATDKNLVQRDSKGDELANELRKKHDMRIKKTMKTALTAMRKVEHVTNSQVSKNPIIAAAAKAITTERGNEIFSVLGLDKNQLNQNYLLKMDNAIQKYNEMPDSHNEEKLQKALVVTHERVRKEKIIEMKAKSEKAAKNKRSADNAAYYKQKWAEKKRELTRKKQSRDTYVKKLKNENKFKKWVQEQNENESGHKNTIYTAEKNKKQTIEKKHKVQREKVYAANANIAAQAKKKFEFEQSQLQAKLNAARADYTTKKNELVTAKESREKARANMHTIRANSERAVSLERAAQAQATAANELKTKFASESNYAQAKKEDDKLAQAKKATAEAQFKYKAVIATMNKKDKVQSQKANEKATALKAKIVAEQNLANHKAKREMELEKANKPPEVIADASVPKDMDPSKISRQQKDARANMLPPQTRSNRYQKARLANQRAGIQAGASVMDPAGKKKPLNAPPGYTPDATKVGVN